MNENIKQLKAQCWVDRTWDTENLRWIDRHIDMNKFAELIIKECASLVVDDDNAYNMLKHFGVEE